MKQSPKNYKRIVIKVGSSLIYSNKLGFDLTIFEHIVEQIICLMNAGKEMAVVSSGAIALGMHVLGLKERPGVLSDLQAVAAIGQNELMNAYHRSFKGKFLTAQVLLTHSDFNDRQRYLNARNTLFGLLEHRRYRTQRPIPIINENDTVSTDEIKFGDNDKLSALVAGLISADLLIILSDVDGLLDNQKKVIKVVPQINSQIKSFACPTNKKTCVGGMITKIEAARIAVDSGVPCVIANGNIKNIISEVIRDPLAGGNWTIFLPKKGYLAARERWIAFGAKPKASIIVDEGAKLALINKKSLLSVGVLALDGEFAQGDIVSVRDKQGYELARGKTGLASKQLAEVKGKRFDKEVIHRDDIVILKEE